MKEVKDPDILKQLNGEAEAPKGMKAVTDPAILAKLSEGASVPSMPEPPKWATAQGVFGKYGPDIYGATGALWETAKPLIELGAAGAGAAPGVLATPINPVLGPAAALAGGGAGYALAKQATRGIDKALGAPSDNTPAPLTKLAGGEKLPQTAQDILSGAEYIAEGEGASRALRGAGKLVKEQAQKAPARIINSLVKPLLKDFSYGKNPGRAIAQEGIVANNFDELVSKISSKRQEIGSQLGTIADALTNSAQKKGVTIDLSSSLKPIDDAIEKASEMPETNKDLISRLNALRRDILGIKTIPGPHQAPVFSEPTRKLSGLTFNETLEIKRMIGDSTKWTGNASDDKAVNAALKKVWGNIKGTVNDAAVEVEPVFAKQFKQLNEKYADMTSAEVAAKYRDKIMERQNMVGFAGRMIGVGTIGAEILSFLTTGGANIPAAIAGASAVALDKALGSTAVKTRVAAWLAKASPEEIKAIETQAPGFAAAIQRAFPAMQTKAILNSGAPEAIKSRWLENLEKEKRR